jgi:hypothetical protein
MLSNITSNSKKHSSDRQSLLKSGDTVYIYDDRTYAGTLIHPIERTYPPKWTVQLERGDYVAANIEDIFPRETNASEIPLSQAQPNTEKTIAQLEQKIKTLNNTIAQLEAENQFIEHQYQEIERENQLLKKDLEQAKQVIRRAKDIAPVMRLSLKRVLRLAHHACMDVQKTVGGWILKMGDKARKFKRLWEVWDIVSQNEFILSEIFPSEKLIDVNLIQPPKRRKRPHPSRFPTPSSPFPITREDLLREQELFAIA